MMFASDNTAPAHPAVMEALAEANAGTAMPYGADPWTEAAEARIRTVFEAPSARVLLVATGTAANALALAGLCPPWGRVFCHRLAHVEVDECNAPEFFTGGAKLTHVDGPHATVSAEALEKALAGYAQGVVHEAQPAMLSITQATERGAVYTADEVARLAGIARARGLAVHMDGTRLANALASTGASPAAMTHGAGVDILCLGATKCGVLAAEAIVLFEPDRHPGLAWQLELRRKRAGHLFSKLRYVAAQMTAWLGEGEGAASQRWLALAGHANAMAGRLRDGLEARGFRPATPPSANLMYLRLDAGAHAALQAAGAVYYAGPPDAAGAVEARLVTSWCTTAGEVDALLAALPEAAAPAAPAA
ncbi:MAG: beta-eliminating lyase-related protein [Pseudomonadota bacterium]